MLATWNVYRAHRHGSESPYPGSTPGLNPCNHLAWLACGPWRTHKHNTYYHVAWLASEEREHLRQAWNGMVWHGMTWEAEAAPKGPDRFHGFTSHVHTSQQRRTQSSSRSTRVSYPVLRLQHEHSGPFYTRPARRSAGALGGAYKRRSTRVSTRIVDAVPVMFRKPAKPPTTTTTTLSTHDHIRRATSSLT